MPQVRMLSTEMVNTPGLLAWAINGYHCISDRTKMIRCLMDGYNLSRQCAIDLLTKKTTFTVDDDNAAVFEYEEAWKRKEGETIYGPMNEARFRQLLGDERDMAISLLMETKVSEWMNDGPEEVARCLTHWAEEKLDLGDDETLMELAEGTSLFDGE